MAAAFWIGQIESALIIFWKSLKEKHNKNNTAKCYMFFLYKHNVNKHTKAEFWWKIKHI